MLEDNWWHGAGGRYTVLLYNANRVVIRRGVIRHDGGWSDDKGDPEAGMNFYNSTNCSAQNVIILDSNTSFWNWQSAFYNVFNNASPNSNANNSWLGIIALNNNPPGFPEGASLRFDGNAPQTGHIIRNAVLWDSNWGMNVSYAADINFDASGLTIGQTARGSNGYGVAGGSGGTKILTNLIVTNMNNADFSGVSATYFDTFNNGEVGGSNHVAVDTNGALNGTGVSPYGVSSCGFGFTSGCMSNGDVWTVNIAYNGTNLTVSVQDGANAVQNLINT